MRLRLRNWYIHQGTSLTVLDIGKYAGSTFEELMMEHPDYVAWAQEEVIRQEDNSDWRLRQLASWATRMAQEVKVPSSGDEAPKSNKMQVETNMKPSQGYVNISVEKMLEMQTQMEAMQEELNEVKRGRKKVTTRTESASEGSFEHLQQ